MTETIVIVYLLTVLIRNIVDQSHYTRNSILSNRAYQLSRKFALTSDDDVLNAFGHNFCSLAFLQKKREEMLHGWVVVYNAARN